MNLRTESSVTTEIQRLEYSFLPVTEPIRYLRKIDIRTNSREIWEMVDPMYHRPTHLLFKTDTTQILVPSLFYAPAHASIEWLSIYHGGNQKKRRRAAFWDFKKIKILKIVFFENVKKLIILIFLIFLKFFKCNFLHDKKSCFIQKIVSDLANVSRVPESHLEHSWINLQMSGTQNVKILVWYQGVGGGMS